MAYMEINLPAGCWNYPTSNPAPLERITGANSDLFVHSFNDTTEEFILLEPLLELPANLNTAGTVYFEIYGMAKTAAADKAVVFKAYYISKQDGEDPDVAYSSKSSGAKSTNATQGRLDKFTFSETVATLGLAANDLLKLKLSRDAGNALDTLVEDYRFCNLRIRIPVT